MLSFNMIQQTYNQVEYHSTWLLVQQSQSIKVTPPLIHETGGTK